MVRIRWWFAAQILDSDLHRKPISIPYKQCDLGKLVNCALVSSGRGCSCENKVAVSVKHLV